MTDRLYYHEPRKVEFSAHVIERRIVDGRHAIVLDQTCFYPTGGGQSHDLGTLNGVAVTDVFIDERDQAVLHVLEREIEAEQVNGQVDWNRRFDHMQQHTGQHILSEAFVRRVGAATVSSHLGDEESTIDVDRTPLGEQELQDVEDLANTIVFENRPVSSRFFSHDEIADVPLRKLPAVEGPVRVVEVRGFDWSACGGTHCQASGEVGLIRIASVERRGDHSRIHFLCGWRALRDYRRKEAVLARVASYLTTGYPEVPAIVQKMDEELRAAQREVQKGKEALAGLEAEALLARAEVVGPARLVLRSYDDRDFVSLKQLASQLLEEPDVVVLLGWKGPQKGQLLFGRGTGVNADMPSLLRQVGKAVGGGGGGRPDLAQGGGMASDRVDEALELARRGLLELTNQGGS